MIGHELCLSSICVHQPIGTRKAVEVTKAINISGMKKTFKLGWCMLSEF
ncbi:hypothetical protein BVRB_000060 [Beta vulgaris subsp. vulgaris]|uniref:Uncharacterized protein n=1 Tax=Beta vulgaris subsp. vulgaris TaxID=3555 RepID=A0A0J8B8X7_BETVV|nr:hypothetical protein BVRB_000060 [Beta vulgaris subsp. vulgaris]